MPAIRPGTKGGVISGWGTSLPEKVLTNHDLAEMMDTSDEWIVTGTGIHERRIGGTTIGLSVESGRQALEMAGRRPAPIDGLVLATTTPDKQWGNAAAVQNELGLRCGRSTSTPPAPASSTALVSAHGLIAMGADRVLVIGTDTLSRITDWDDRDTAVLFADGSGAVVIESVEGRGQLLGWDLDADGSSAEYLYAEVGGFIQMEGKEVFRRAVRIMVDSAEKSMDAAGCHADDIALVVPHQANTRIIQAACDRLGIEMDRAAVVLDRTGNTSSASIPWPSRRRPRTGPGARRRPHSPRRLRRRDDRGEHDHPLGRRAA